MRIAVIGSGPAGSLCALLLARLGIDVTIIVRDRIARTNKTREVMKPSTVLLLERFGLILPENCCERLDTFYAYWDAQLQHHCYSFWSIQTARLLSREQFDRWLLEEAIKNGVEVIQGGQIVQTEQGWHLPSISGPIHYVVIATGRWNGKPFAANRIRVHFDNLVVHSIDYFDTGEPVCEASVEAVPAGWLFLAKAKDGNANLYLATDGDLDKKVDRVATICEQLRLTEFLQTRVSIDRICKLRSLDARTSRCRPYYGDRWLAIGDSLWTIDPLAGIGVERSIQSAMLAVDAIQQAILSPFSSATVFSEFAIQEDEKFFESIAQKRSVYRLENRFRDFPFWKRRNAEAASSPHRTLHD